jgi:hypothetical protein
VSQTKWRLWTALAYAVTLGAAAPQKPTDSFTIIAGQQFGPIRETTTRAQIEKLFGGAVKDADVYLGEGAPRRAFGSARPYRTSFESQARC